MSDDQQQIKGFTFLPSFDEVFEACRNDDALTLKFFHALRDYWFRDIAPAFTGSDAMAWRQMAYLLDRSRGKRKKLSDTMQGNSNAKKQPETVENSSKQLQTVQNSSKQFETVENRKNSIEEKRRGENRRVGVKEKTDKKEFAPHVHLTEAEHSTLVAKHGANVVAWCIDKLDSYKESSGKTYKSDAGAIRQWVLSAYDKEHPQTNNRTTDDIVKAREQAIADDIEEIRRTHPEAQIL